MVPPWFYYQALFNTYYTSRYLPPPGLPSVTRFVSVPAQIIPPPSSVQSTFYNYTYSTFFHTPIGMGGTTEALSSFVSPQKKPPGKIARAHRTRKRSSTQHYPRSSTQPYPLQKGLNATSRGRVKFNTIFIDFNYLLKSAYTVVIKEMAIVGLTEDGTEFQQSYIVHSPVNVNGNICEMSVNKRLIDLHGIDWADGNVNIIVLRHLMTMFEDASVLYILDEKKLNYFKRSFFTPVEVRSFDSGLSQFDLTEQLTPQPLLCAFHVNKPGKSCALNDAYAMYKRFDAHQRLQSPWNEKWKLM